MEKLKLWKQLHKKPQDAEAPQFRLQAEEMLAVLEQYKQDNQQLKAMMARVQPLMAEVEQHKQDIKKLKNTLA